MSCLFWFLVGVALMWYAPKILDRFFPGGD